ncbi:MAG: DegT/DnrJ/EryC1/StrS family aminotransferase [Victivallaceae bacterium]|nr:DegT/DnrJ/EryC1/StrS family aminotransferase [Victivallaceae bacterium]
MAIPLVNLQRNYQKYESDYSRLLLETASSCQFIMGNALKQFEADFAEYLGVKHVLGVGSGTDALTLLLKAHGVAGKTVLTQNNTFIATALAIGNAGGKIALCDVDEQTYQIDADSYTGPTPDVVMPVHLYGYPYDTEKIKAKFGNDIVIIEDACQAHGSILNGSRCGSLGLGAGFSFYPGKNLGAFGDGGAVATNDDNLAEEIMALRNWGGRIKYVHDREGGNSRLDTLQAAILGFKLSHLDAWNQLRNERAEQYRQLLGDCQTIILPPETPANSLQNCHLFVIRLKEHDRDQVLKQLNEQGIGAGIHYPVPIHLQKVYQNMEFAKQSFPVSTTIAGQIISLPMFPEMAASETATVAETLLAILNS